MKNLLVFFLLCALFSATCLQAVDISAKPAEDIKDNQFNLYHNIGYVKPNNWQCAQGLCCDGTYFYFASHHDQTKELSDIHKIRMSDNKEVAHFVKQAPWHSPGLDFWVTRGTVLTCCYGPRSMPRTPCVWELDRDTGEAVNKWDCPEIGHKQGGLIAWENDNDIILLTSVDGTSKVGFTRMTLMPGGAYLDNGTWYYEGPNFGILQGMDFYGGYVYLLADAGKKVVDDPHVIYVLKLNNDKDKTITVTAQYHFSIFAETEGLTFDSEGNLYFGTAEGKIFRFNVKGNKLKPYKKINDSHEKFRE